MGYLAGQENGQGNLHLDPLFCNIETDVGLRLRGDSPCAEENNPSCGQIGSYGIGCDAPVPILGTTWGRIRESFR